MGKGDRADERIFNETVTGLLIESLHRKGELTIRAGGWSMVPVIFPGDSITIRACSPEDVAVGDVVLVKWREAFILHRVYRIEPPLGAGKLGFRTKGDFRLSPDWPFAAENAVGKVVDCGRAAPRKILWRAMNALARAAMRVLASAPLRGLRRALIRASILKAH